MATFDTYGNDDKAMTIEVAGAASGTFDSFECAIHALAPSCGHCGHEVLQDRAS